MFAINNELDAVTSFIAQERNEHLQRDMLNANLKSLTGLMILKNVEEYGDQADYDAIIQEDGNGELLKLIGLYMSEITPAIANNYAKLIIERLMSLSINYWKREVEDAIEEKINYYQDRETKEDDSYDGYSERNRNTSSGIYSVKHIC